MALRVLGAVACGGALGALARYGLGVAFPYGPWTVLVVNATGCLLIGVLMGLTEDVLLRTFLGTGVLGGYTTFSTYVVDFQRFASQGRPAIAVAYLGGTLALALLAVYSGTALAGRVRR
ncbi:fluoride efflux transporter FluC [Umezawaea tangerina]|uniref:Fluoride-specific ion channel FluC n=1 Tax=Umezawaea tangerina TaxID=84725 RepID=A0A2T0SL19_9PSEU|nr:CrcB family protein [Umezawaea tangerina]PRY34111.1 CrcB protein [Umezawaea tangerina]